MIFIFIFFLDEIIDFIKNKFTIEEINIIFLCYVLEGKIAKKIKDKRILVLTCYRIFICGRMKNVKNKVIYIYILIN